MDFRVAIPEGETLVTITSRDASNEELGPLTIKRYGAVAARKRDSPVARCRLRRSPSGGAFRVVDVIVTEAPRFAQ